MTQHAFTFAQNLHRHGRAHEAIGRAIWKLSLEGYVALEFKSGNPPSVRLDRPYEGLPVQVTQHGDKTFGSVEHLGCRLYWPVPQSVTNPNPETSQP